MVTENKDESVQPAVSTETPAPKVEDKPPVQPLTEDRLKQLLAEERTAIMRQSQSERDKAIASIQREAARKTQEQADELATLRAAMQGYNPDSGEDVKAFLGRAEREAAKESQLRRYQVQEQEEQRRAAMEGTLQTFKEGLSAHIAELGVTTDDIEWGDISEGLSAKQARILKEVGKRRKELAAKEKESAKAELEAERLKLRREMGVDMPPEGEGVGGGESFTEAQIKDRVFWEANKEKIMKAYEKGLIKE